MRCCWSVHGGMESACALCLEPNVHPCLACTGRPVSGHTHECSRNAHAHPIRWSAWRFPRTARTAAASGHAPLPGDGGSAGHGRATAGHAASGNAAMDATASGGGAWTSAPRDGWDAASRSLSVCLCVCVSLRECVCVAATCWCERACVIPRGRSHASANLDSSAYHRRYALAGM